MLIIAGHGTRRGDVGGEMVDICMTVKRDMWFVVLELGFMEFVVLEQGFVEFVVLQTDTRNNC